MHGKRLAVCLILILAAAAAGGIWYFLKGPDEETRIRRLLEDTAATAGKNGDTKPIRDAADFRTLVKRLAPVITVSGGNRYASGDFPARELVQRFMAARHLLQSLNVQMDDLTITLDSAEEATAEFTLTVSGRLRDRTFFRDFFECTLTLIRGEEEPWILRTAELSPVVEQHDI